MAVDAARPMLGVLGPFHVIRCDTSVDLAGTKRRRLAALFVAEDGRPRNHDWLAANLWTDDELPRDYETTVRVYVSRLRRAGIPIETRPSGYALSDDAVTDLRTFRRLVGDASSADSPDTAGLLLTALDVWKGRAFEDFSDCEALVRSSSILDDERSMVACSAADRILADKTTSALLGGLLAVLERFVADVPERDEVVARLALCQWRLGQTSAAVSTLARLDEALGWLPPCSTAVSEAIEAGIVPDRFDWQPILVDRLPSAGTRRPRMIPLLQTTPPLVERSEQLSRLATVVGAIGCQPTLTLITGRVGAGKTRLLVEAGHSVPADIDVRFGRFEPDFREPLTAFKQAFPSLQLGSSTSANGAAIDQGRVVAVTADAICAACDRPTVLLLDELHDADSLSLLVLRHVLTSARTPPLAVIAAMRVDVELPESIGVLRDRLRRTQSLVTVHAGDLTAAGVGQLLDGMAPGSGASASEIVELTGGNPYLTTLIVGQLASVDDLATARDTTLGAAGDFVNARVARIDNERRKHLEVMSVIGLDSELELFEAVSDLSTERAVRSLQGLVDSGLLVDKGTAADVYGFEHELFRRAIYEGVPPARRRDLHERIGRALDGLPGLATQRERAASHWIDAGSADEGARCLLDAARAAAAGFAFDDAIRFAERGLSVASETSIELHADLRLVVARATADSGRLEDATVRHREAYAAARLAGRHDLIVEAVIGASGAYVPNTYDDARLLRILAAIRDVETPALRSRMLSRLVLLQYGRGDQAADWALEAQSLAERCNDPAAIAVALSARCLTTFGPGRHRSRLDLAIDGLDVAGRLPTRDPEVTLTTHAVIAALELDDIDLARGLIERLERSGAAPLGPLARWWVQTMKTSISAAIGALDAADDSARTGREMADHIGVTDAAAWFFMQLWSHNHLRGSYGTLERVFARRLADVHVSWRLAAAVELLAAGSTERAIEVLDGALVEVGRLSTDYLYTGTMKIASIAGVMADHPIASIALARLEPFMGTKVVYGSCCGFLGEATI